jgi:phthalate 4,5-dioxygenase
MLSTEDNDILCRVEGNAPMGQLMRRHWIPACMSEEVAEPDGAPRRIRLLGEELVVFRDSRGRLGVLDEHCPHRRASLAFGRNEECGLRCLYHGWKMDVDGNVVEAASEPQGSRVTERIRVKSYPAREGGGLVWVYMGPRDEMTDFPTPAWVRSPRTKVSIVKIQVSCNWAQILEGAIDSAHSSSLHSSEIRTGTPGDADETFEKLLRPSTDTSPRLEFDLTSYGLRYAAIRRPTIDPETHDYVRITAFIAPLTVLIPPNPRHGVVQLTAPIDDTHTMFYFMAWSDAGTAPDQEAWRKYCGAQVGIDLDDQYRNRRTLENGYLQDRQTMKLGSFTGIRGIPNQDIVMWETMGPIADRSQERLGSSDVAVAQFRRIMVRAARAFAADGEVIGLTEPRVPQIDIRSFAGVVPKTIDWRGLPSGDELSYAREKVPG